MVRYRLVAASVAALVIAALACSSSLPSGLRLRSIDIVLAPSTLAVGQTATATAVVKDEAGNPVVPGDVVWTSSNPTVATVAAAQITALSTGSTEIAASSQGVTAAATLTVTPAPTVPVATVVVALNSSSLIAGQSTQATATTYDAGGAVLTGRTIDWSSSNTSVATVSGSGLVMAVGAGTAQVTATSEGRSGAASVQATAASTVGPPTQVAMAVQPAGALSGRVLTTQPIVQVRDAAGSLVSSSTASVTASLASGTGTLLGTTTVAAVNGVATFTNLRIDGAGAHTLTFVSTGLTAATSANVTVTQTPASLAISRQPSGATTGSPLVTQPIVRILDNAGLLIANSTLVVTSTIASGTGTLTGGSATAVGGVATFTTLRVDGSGTVSLTFSTASPPLQVTSAAFAVAQSTPATQLTITTQPSASATSGSTFSQQPVIQLRAASNAAVAQAGVAVTVAIASGGGTLGGTKTVNTNASGVAAFTNLSISGTSGARTLTFTSGTLTAATSSAIAVSAPVSDEPAFSAGTNTMVYQDNMDSYVDVVSMGAVAPSTPRIVPRPSPVTTSQPVDTRDMQLITSGRSGKAIRLAYDGSVQNGPTFLTMNMPSTPDLATHYFQYYARVTPSAPFTNHLAHKWFMAYHRHNAAGRAEWDTHDHLPCNVDSHDTYWHFYDNAKETTCQGQQPIGPHFNEDIADGQWHRFTYAYRPHTSAGSRDGFARMWIDGVKMMDVSQSAVGVTPPGGEKPWCAQDDVDAILVADGIVNQFFGSVQTSYTSPPWTLDVDDYSWWIKP